MSAFFLIAAVVGGTVLVCQFVLTLLGLGGEHGIDLGHDVPHDFGGGAGHDGFAGHDAFSGHNSLAEHGGSADDGIGHDGGHQHGSSWLFAAISFRTLVAAFTFFGLVGLAAQSAEQPLGVQLVLAVAAGLGAMYGVHWLITRIGRLGNDATLRVKSALGQEGTVYIPIAGGRAQAGKIQLQMQNRLVEYEAITSSSERLPTGAKVRVVGIAGSVLEVEPVKAAVAS